jgi:hypothetical protein
MIPLSFNTFEAIPLSREPAKVLIRWSLNPSNVPLDDYVFYVDRGNVGDAIPNFQKVDIDGHIREHGSPSTNAMNLERIAGPISAGDFYEYVDYIPELNNLNQSYSYRIRLRQISTADEVLTPVFTFDPLLDLVGLYIVDENNFLLEDTTGIPCLVYQKRRTGVVCDVCFDKIQKKRLSSSCTNCFNTNWVGGFYKPVDCYIDFSPNPKNVTIQEWGEVQENVTNIFLSNYPSLVPGDVIRELANLRLWRVVRVQQTEKRRVPMLQFAQVTMLKPGDIEYKMPMDEKLVREKIEYLDRQRKLREF